MTQIADPGAVISASVVGEDTAEGLFGRAPVELVILPDLTVPGLTARDVAPPTGCALAVPVSLRCWGWPSFVSTYFSSSPRRRPSTRQSTEVWQLTCPSN